MVIWYCRMANKRRSGPAGCFVQPDVRPTALPDWLSLEGTVAAVTSLVAEIAGGVRAARKAVA